MKKSLPISGIRLDGGTQVRAEINQEAVDDYATALIDGVALPPVVVFHDGKQHWLADGFHRLAAAVAAGKDRIAADVRDGTARDALLHALGANESHGLRRSNADKRRAVEICLDDPALSQLEGREIARLCHVSHTLVQNVLSAKLATMPPERPTRVKQPKDDDRPTDEPRTEPQDRHGDDTDEQEQEQETGPDTGVAVGPAERARGKLLDIWHDLLPDWSGATFAAWLEGQAQTIREDYQ